MTLDKFLQAQREAFEADAATWQHGNRPTREKTSMATKTEDDIKAEQTKALFTWFLEQGITPKEAILHMVVAITTMIEIHANHDRAEALHGLDLLFEAMRMSIKATMP